MATNQSEVQHLKGHIITVEDGYRGFLKFLTSLFDPVIYLNLKCGEREKMTSQMKPYVTPLAVAGDSDVIGWRQRPCVHIFRLLVVGKGCP